MTNNLNCKCKYCGSDRINKMSIIRNKQRYLCRDCKRTFREGKDKRKKYSEDFKIEAIKWYLENVGIRSIARRLKISASLVSYWIKQFGQIIKDKMLNAEVPEDIKDIEILEADEIVTYIKKNLKIKKDQAETFPSYGLLLIGTEIKLLILK